MATYFILVFLAAVCKAVADTIAHHKDRSVFRRSKFWSQDGKILPLTKYKLDGWHICNSLFLIFTLTAGPLYKPLFGLLIDLPSAGILFILAFNLFYNKILLK